MRAQLLALWLMMGLAVAGSAFTYVSAPPKVVIFDLKQTLDSYQDKLLEAGLDDDEHAARLRAFDRQLKSILEDYARQHHLTIMVPGAVITGAPDLTEALQRHVISELKKNTK